MSPGAYARGQTLPEIQYNGVRQIACRQFISGLDSRFMTTAKAVRRESVRTGTVGCIGQIRPRPYSENSAYGD